MEKNKKRIRILQEQADLSKVQHYDAKKNTVERLKKPLIFTLMGIVCMGCIYLIFKPATYQKQSQSIGLNNSVPQPAQAVLQEDKQKAYEHEMLQEKQEQRRQSLTSLSDYWTEENSADQPIEQIAENEASGNREKPTNPALTSYHNAQRTLGTFYQEDNSQGQQLRKEIDQLRDQLAQKEVPAPITVNDQLELMERSYQMAAKYLPSGSTAVDTSKNSTALPASSRSKSTSFAAFSPKLKTGVSSLFRDSLQDQNRGFYTLKSKQQMVLPKNSVRACVLQTQTITGEGVVRLRLLESAQISNHIIAAGTLLSAKAKIQAGRLELKVTSLALQGTIIPVALTIYDLDGQQGLYVPYSTERSAISEMAGNMSQQSGTSFMLTQSAGQQVATDLSRGLVQGISGYFSKKIKAQKVILKSGHQMLLVPQL